MPIDQIKELGTATFWELDNMTEMTLKALWMREYYVINGARKFHL